MNASNSGLVWRSVGALVVVMLVTIGIGFAWLPSVQADYRAQGLWAAICGAAGVPTKWGEAGAPKKAITSTRVVLEERMMEAGGAEAVGRGATLALRCTMCHGPQGLSAADTPNLAGQYADVIIKQLLDYQQGDRTSAIMQSLATQLSRRDIDDLAAYFSNLPRPRNTPDHDMSRVPQLVRTGDPMRNVAPCASCHGGIERKIGTPWLEGMPKEYLVQQMAQFASGERHNDGLAQMRNMARALKGPEIQEIAVFYARHAEGESH
jgi:cytochrome c553